MSVSEHGTGSGASRELAEAVASSRNSFVGVALISGAVNLLMLTGSIYMLQVYDRVLTSGSIPTLLALTLIMVVLYAALAFFDAIRQRILTRIGMALDASLSRRIYDTIIAFAGRGRPQGDGLQPLRDLDNVRGFLTSQGPVALFDAPWIPLYMALCFLLHPLLGLAALVGAIILVITTVITDIKSRRPMDQLLISSNARTMNVDASRRNAEAVIGMGMADAMYARFNDANGRALEAGRVAGDIAADYGSFAKSLRFVLQSLVLGIGAWLVIRGEATAGVMIASSILSARALAPIDSAIAAWRPFLAARQSWGRLTALLSKIPPRVDPMPLPAPKGVLQVQDAVVFAPGSPEPTLTGISFRLEAGSVLGLIGPSAAGKSTLGRVLVGVWPAARGEVRLDGALLSAWSEDARGRFVGYLPQDVSLFDGTVAENIARFDRTATADEVIAAARAAGAHEMILALPKAYDTVLGDGGTLVSAGQRQRIALARALFRDPFLVVLDEPNANLDAEGEAALTGAIQGVGRRGGIVVVIAHRPSTMAAVDQVLVLNNGRIQQFGPRDEVLSKVLAPRKIEGVSPMSRPVQSAM